MLATAIEFSQGMTPLVGPVQEGFPIPLAGGLIMVVVLLLLLRGGHRLVSWWWATTIHPSVPVEQNFSVYTPHIFAIFYTVVIATATNNNQLAT